MLRTSLGPLILKVYPVKSSVTSVLR